MQNIHDSRQLMLVVIILARAGLALAGDVNYGWLVIGGSYASRNEFPWMVRIYSDIPYTDTFACGATLISDRWLLTSAHCVYNGAYKATTVRAYLGKLDLSTELEEGEQFRSVNSANIFVHPNYYPAKNTDYDFALIKFDDPLAFTAAVKPIDLPPDTLCLPDVDYTASTTGVDSCINVEATGWGRPGPTDYMSYILKKVNLTIAPFERCESAFDHDYFTIAKICAQGQPGQQTCRGDSGGPLTCRAPDGIRFLIGVTSYGEVTCNMTGSVKPAVYARLCSVLPWIRNFVRIWSNRQVAPRRTTVPAAKTTLRRAATTTTTATSESETPPEITTVATTKSRRQTSKTTTTRKQTTRKTTVRKTTTTARPVPTTDYQDSTTPKTSSIITVAVMWTTTTTRRRNSVPDVLPAQQVSGTIDHNPQNRAYSYFVQPPEPTNCSDPNSVIVQLSKDDFSTCPLDTMPNSVKSMALFNAIRGSYTSVVTSLVTDGAVDPNVEEYYPNLGYRQSALILATRWHRAEIVRRLLQNGANINARPNGKTALDYAACTNQGDIMDILRNNGGNNTAGCKCDDNSACSKRVATKFEVQGSQIKNNSNNNEESDDEDNDSQASRSGGGGENNKPQVIYSVAVSYKLNLVKSSKEPCLIIFLLISTFCCCCFLSDDDDF